MPSSSVRAMVWRARLAEWWASAWRWVLMAAGALLAVYLLLDRGVSNGVVTAAAIGVLVIGVTVTGSKPMAIALMAMPALFIGQRVGFGASDLSVSDVALAAAFGAAILLGDRHFSRPMRQILWLNFFYQFATLLTVIVNPHPLNTVEWFHAWLLVSGAVIVGWALGRSGYAGLAFRLILIAASVVAAGTLVTALFQYAGGNFEAVYPAWPVPMHKNFAGTVMAFAALVAYVGPEWTNLSKRWTRPVLVFLLIAIVMTQSRQALIGLLVAVVVIVARRGVAGRARWLALLAIPAAWLVVITVIDQFNSQNQFNSLYQRLDWWREVYAFWKTGPIFGHGLRFWNFNPVVPYQPPQAELEVVASAGLVGLFAFVVMWIGILIVLWRVNPTYGTLAFAVTLSRLLQAQFDLFWVAAQVSIPFVIAGVCLGAMARSDAVRDAPRRVGEIEPAAHSAQGSAN